MVLVLTVYVSAEDNTELDAVLARISNLENALDGGGGAGGGGGGGVASSSLGYSKGGATDGGGLEPLFEGIGVRADDIICSRQT